MNCQNHTDKSCPTPRASAALSAAAGTLRAHLELIRFQDCASDAPGQSTEVQRAHQQMSEQSLALAREFSSWYAKLSARGELQELLDKALGQKQARHTKAIAAQVEQVLSLPDVQAVFRDQGISADTLKTHLDEVAELEAELELGTAGLAVVRPDVQKFHLELSASPEPALLRLIRPDLVSWLSTLDEQALGRLVLTPRFVKTQAKPSLDDSLVSAVWSLAHGARQREREARDLGTVVFQGGDGGAGAVISAIGFVVAIIGLLLAAGGGVIRGLCVSGRVTDEDVCEAGDWLIGIGIGLAVAGTAAWLGGAAAAGRSPSAYYTIEADGRILEHEEVDLGGSSGPGSSSGGGG